MTITEIKKLEEIHGRSCPEFPFPKLHEPLFIIQIPLYEGNELVGAAITHVTSEIILILNKDLTRLQRARAVKRAFNKLRERVPDNGFTDAHIWVFGDDFDKVLKKHFNFVDTTGKSLYWRLNHG